MNLSTSSRRRIQAAALLAPILIVQGASWLLGGGPAAAPAATTPAPAPVQLDAVLAPARAAPTSAPQQRCLAYLADRPSPTALRSPMAHDLPAAVAELPDDVLNVPAEVSEPSLEPAAPIPDLKLTAILDNRSGGMAAIDGRIHRPGDVLTPGWRLTRIEAAEDRILITSDSGQTAHIALRRDLPR